MASVKKPVLFSNQDMLEEAKRHIDQQKEPYYTSWIKTKENADKWLGKLPNPQEFDSYWKPGMSHAFAARDIGLVYALFGAEDYAEKAKEILFLWADVSESKLDEGGDDLTIRGLKVGRAMTVFCYAYTLIFDTLSNRDKDILKRWFLEMTDIIRKSQQRWIDKEYFDHQHFNNHLGAQTMGLAAIGFSLQDPAMIRYAMDDPANKRNARILTEGTILMPGDELWHEDPSLHGWVPVQPGEIYDRYRVVQGHGLHYTILHLRFLTLLAEMSLLNNDINLYEFVGRKGESLKLSFEFYSDLFIHRDPGFNGGYYKYKDEKVRMDDMSLYELAHRRYPNNGKIKEVLQACSRDVFDNQTFGWSTALVHGMD
jgi:hypothetical protein